ncbi:phage tail protein [Nodularia sp. NIES-3585]|uniref:phage tail protein n=1 Tax=Nodularia sp. NIES-3585 TaxID=1973477 RepID=UPI000B5C9D1A|nr:phage tail protein [Nodularia sp. NIES-3585]GAX37260.1 phage tail protein [Nodularia sp. NIES-3585]
MNPKFTLLKAALAAGSAFSFAGHDPYMAYNFVVEIGGVLIGGFSEVSGLSSEIDLESYEEGGLNDYVHKFPKHTTCPNLILSRGLVRIDLFYLWYQATSQGLVQQLSGTIFLLNSQQIPVMWWVFKKAYPVKWEGPQFNASSEEIAIERIELVHQGLSKLQRFA